MFYLMKLIHRFASLAIFIGIFVLLRKLVLWYWRVNEFFKLAEENLKEQKIMKEAYDEQNKIQEKILIQFESLNNNLLRKSKLSKISNKDN